MALATATGAAEKYEVWRCFGQTFVDSANELLEPVNDDCTVYGFLLLCAKAPRRFAVVSVGFDVFSIFGRVSHVAISKSSDVLMLKFTKRLHGI